MFSSVIEVLEIIDECLRHSYYTRVGLSFSRLFYINYIVFVVRSLIWCMVWMQVYWSEKSSCWKQVLEQWGSEQGSDCHVATSPRRDVATSRRQLEICTLSFKVRNGSEMGDHREAYEGRHGIPEQSGTDFEDVPGICTVFHCLVNFGY